jgi:transposase
VPDGADFSLFSVASRSAASRRPAGSQRHRLCIRNGLQWKDAPRGYGPHKTFYNRFIRWSRLGVFDRMAGEGPKPERIMIDATHLKAHGPRRVS